MHYYNIATHGRKMPNTVNDWNVAITTNSSYTVTSNPPQNGNEFEQHDYVQIDDKLKT